MGQDAPAGRLGGLARSGVGARLGRRVPRAVRAALGWVAVVLLAWVVGGVWLAGPVILLAGWHLVREPRPRLLIAGAVVVLTAVPVVWLVLRPDTDDRISAGIVLDDPWPGRLAALGLLLLAIGVLRADRSAGEGE